VAIRQMQGLGLTVAMVTGDNRRSARPIGQRRGRPGSRPGLAVGQGGSDQGTPGPAADRPPTVGMVGDVINRRAGTRPGRRGLCHRYGHGCGQWLPPTLRS